MSLSEIIPFDFENNQIRAITDQQGDPWLVAADVCAVLGLSTEQTRRLDEDEKGLRLIHTLGGQQKMVVINESGFYALVFRSDKPKAKELRKFVTSVILPSIRKTGSYTTKTHKAKISKLTLVNRAFGSALSVAKKIHKDPNQAILAANNWVKNSLDVDVLEEFGGTKMIAPVQVRYLTPTELGTELGTSAIKVNKQLQQLGLQTERRDHKNRLIWEATAKGEPYSILIDSGKRHSNGKAIQVLNWYPTVLDVLRANPNPAQLQAVN